MPEDSSLTDEQAALSAPVKAFISYPVKLPT